MTTTRLRLLYIRIRQNMCSEPRQRACCAGEAIYRGKLCEGYKNMRAGARGRLFISAFQQQLQRALRRDAEAVSVADKDNTGKGDAADDGQAVARGGVCPWVCRRALFHSLFQKAHGNDAEAVQGVGDLGGLFSAFFGFSLEKTGRVWYNRSIRLRRRADEIQFSEISRGKGEGGDAQL